MPQNSKKSDDRIAKAKAAAGLVAANKTAAKTVEVAVDPNTEVKALLLQLLKKLS